MYSTSAVLDRCWKQCLISYGFTLLLRPCDDIKFIATRLRRRRTALERGSSGALSQAFAQYQVRVEADAYKIHLEMKGIKPDSLRYIVRQLAAAEHANGYSDPVNWGLLSVELPPAQVIAVPTKDQACIA